MSQIEGANKVRAKLSAASKQFDENNEAVIVGYTQKYAIYVHENLTARHAEGKQAKFLEQPARTLRGELATIVTDTYRKTRSLKQGLLLAGLRLQRESQNLVPIDTSALKNSAFTAFEKDVETRALAAYQESNLARTRELNRRNKTAKAKSQRRKRR